MFGICYYWWFLVFVNLVSYFHKLWANRSPYITENKLLSKGDGRKWSLRLHFMFLNYLFLCDVFISCFSVCLFSFHSFYVFFLPESVLFFLLIFLLSVFMLCSPHFLFCVYSFRLFFLIYSSVFHAFSFQSVIFHFLLFAVV